MTGGVSGGLQPVLTVAAAEARALPVDGFLAAVRAAVDGGARPVILYGRPGDEPAALVVTCVLAGGTEGAGRGLELLRTTLDPTRGWHALSDERPRFHAWERELWEQHGLAVRGHPWLKPLRFEGARRGRMDDYPFLRVEGKEVHEVAVGPIHAGVIEPGAFRFMCLGETVHQLEIALGYQHRGVEALLAGRDAARQTPLLESLAGDSAVAYALAWSRAVEALAGEGAGHTLRSEWEPVRGIALELERIAMHLVGLAGLATDVAFLPGASTYGRLRTSVINATQRICGNRFGRGWVRPGGARFGLDRGLVEATRAALDALRRDKAGIDRLMFASRSVAHRLRGAGALGRETAASIGLLGLAARASGLPLDLRRDLPDPAQARWPIALVTEPDGDCWARCRLRAREIEASLDWIGSALDGLGGEVPHGVEPPGPLRPDTVCVSLVEGWRGEVVVALETDRAGRIRHAKLQDPSLLNWLGLALAVRENPISDFPICNKSFDLSYCGNDL